MERNVYRNLTYQTYSPESDVDEVYYYHEGTKMPVKGSSIFCADEEELARQDNVHHLGHAILGSQFFGPVEYLLSTPPIQGGRRNVLEVGCGTGSWIRDMARMFPHVDFLGLDVLPTPPPADRPRPVATGGPSGLLTRNVDDDDDNDSVTEVSNWSDHDYAFSDGEDTLAGDGWGPDGWNELPNVTFMEKDVTEGLQYDDDTFDVIHVRFVFSVAMAFHLIPGVLRSLTRVLRPGGLLLVVDSCVPFCMSDNSPLIEGSGTLELFHAVRNAVTEMGLNPDTREKIVGLVQDTGAYSEIESKEVILPLGPWPEDLRLRMLGNIGLASLHAGFKSVIPILRQSGYDDGRISWLMSRIHKEFDTQPIAKAGLSWTCTHLWARKSGSWAI